MSDTTKTRTHTRGRGRIYFGAGLCLLALFWLAKKVGWLGVGTSGLLWPVLALGLGLAIVLGGRLGRHETHRRKVAHTMGGGS